MSAFNFTEDNELDYILLAGVRSPGRCVISGASRKEKWDVKDADGQDGASTVRKGKTPAQFSVAFSLHADPMADEDDFDRWRTFLKTLRTTVTGKEPIALDIYHPDLAELDIKAVVVESIGAKTHDGKGGATIQVGFLEYSPPKPKKSKGPSGSKSGGNPPSGDKEDPNDPLVQARKKLDSLNAEAGKTP